MLNYIFNKSIIYRFLLKLFITIIQIEKSQRRNQNKLVFQIYLHPKLDFKAISIFSDRAMGGYSYAGPVYVRLV